MAVICDSCFMYGNHEAIKPFAHFELCKNCREELEEFVKNHEKYNIVEIKGCNK